MKKTLQHIIIFFAVLAVPLFAYAGESIVYKGVLATDDGTSVRNTIGQVNMTFTFYDKEFDGNPVQSFSQFVTVDNGKFSVNLPVDALKSDIEYWVDLSINGESLGRSKVDMSEIVRSHDMISKVKYALTSHTVETQKQDSASMQKQKQQTKQLKTSKYDRESQSFNPLRALERYEYYKKPANDALVDVEPGAGADDSADTIINTKKERFQKEVESGRLEYGFVDKYIAPIMKSIKKIFERLVHVEKVMEYNREEIRQLHKKDKELDGRIKRLETKVLR